MADTIKTSVLIDQVDVTLKNTLKKEISVAAKQVFNKDTFLNPYDANTGTGGYYNYVQNLDALNEEYYIAITQSYDVATATTDDGVNAVDTLIPPYESHTEFMIGDMLGYRTAVTAKCNETHAEVKKATNLQQYLAVIETLANNLQTCVDYLEKQENFENLNWII